MFFDREAHKVVNATLDKLGLAEKADRLVVVGGAAMALNGMRDIDRTDIDIVVMPEIMEEADVVRYSSNPNIGLLPSAWALENNKSHRSAFIAKHRQRQSLRYLHLTPVDVFVMPFDDLVASTSEDLIECGEHAEGCRYLSLPLDVVHDLKIQVAAGGGTQGSYNSHLKKHIIDAWKIRERLLGQSVTPPALQ